MEHNGRVISLPVGIVSPTDIARLSREIESIDEFFREQAIRSGGTTNAMPRLSKLMDQLAADNQINLLDELDRSKILDLLQKLHASAPVMHISFSVDPPGAYVQKIVAWLRANIHQHILVTVGLQPNIGAGCVVRTTNKLFDFSLREFFSEKRQSFIDRLHIAISDSGQSEQITVAEPEIAALPTIPQPAIQTPLVTENVGSSSV